MHKQHVVIFDAPFLDRVAKLITSLLGNPEVMNWFNVPREEGSI